MLLRSNLPTDFWWDAYETSNYITNRLPTKTAKGYQTPFEGVYKEIPDLSLLRVWGCKSYLKIPKTYMRKDWRDKTLSGYFMGYSTEGEMGYKIYVPELKSVVVGVNCVFNEVIPTYTEEYFQELNKMQIETLKIPSTVENFVHLIGIKYIDDESGLEFETTRIAIYQGLIVGYRAPVLLGGKLGKEEKSPIHVADIVRMCGASTSSTTEGPDSGRHIRGILSRGAISCRSIVTTQTALRRGVGQLPKEGQSKIRASRVRPKCWSSRIKENGGRAQFSKFENQLR
jgi:hypothetical protein